MSVVGAAPNLRAAIARRFGREGMPVGLISRNAQKLAELTESRDVENVAYRPAGSRDAEALSGAITSPADELRPVQVLEYSPPPAKEFMEPILETTVDDVRGPLEFSVLGTVAATTAVLEPMLERRSGTILLTTGGAAINPYPLRAGVGISFAAEVAYARMLQDEVSDRGVHVAHTAIGGRIAPGGDH